jgi:putative PIN family toxin of toxin-antitoxin system
MNAPRVVLDTHVLVSALLFRTGSLVWLRGAWQAQAIRPLASRETIAELIRVLGYPKFRLAEEDWGHLLGDYLPWCETIAEPRAADIPDCRDPFDRKFLVLAIAAKADALVTGDRDLLDLAPSFAVPILTPAEFKDRVT